MNDNLIKKVKKCLALSKSSNEHEAANALRQAKALMDKYGITMDDVALSDVSESSSMASQSQTTPKYVHGLINQVKSIMGCHAFLSHTLCGKTQVIFVGVSPNDDLASYAFDSLLRRLNSARSSFIKNQCNRVRKRSQKTRRADIFCLGWVLAVQKQIKSLKVEQPAVVGQYMAEKHSDLVDAKTRNLNPKGSAKDNRDFTSGLNKGATVDLNRPVNGESRKALQ